MPEIVIIREEPERLIVHGPGAPAAGLLIVREEPQRLVVHGPGLPAAGIVVIAAEPERLVIRAAGLQGRHGWTPVLAIALDGARRVLEVTGWTGGTGDEPAAGYVGPTGLVPDIADGVDLASTAAAEPYEHVQASSSAEWIINHNLGRNVSLYVLDSAGNGLLCQALNVTTNQARVYFNAALTGRALCF